VTTNYLTTAQPYFGNHLADQSSHWNQ